LSLAALVLAAPAALRANLPPVETATPYRLVEGSTLTAECFPCDSLPITVPIEGGFRLRRSGETPLWTRYEVLGLKLSSPGSEILAKGAEGEGVYSLGGEAALLQELLLETVLDAQAAVVFASARAPVQAPVPWIEIDLVQTPVPDRGWFYRLHLVATPWARIHFSTVHGFHAAGAGGSAAERVSSGDLLTPSGRVLRTNGQLAAKLGILPSVPDLGLDAAVGTAAFDPARPHEIWFSIEEDVFSETLGLLHHGDLLSENGTLARGYAEFLRLFVPQPPVPDFGLDAVALGPNLTTLFSIERSFFSERLGKTVSRGDVLSDDGKVFRSAAELLARFQPTSMPEGGFGLDAVHLWHHGEVWFSTEESFGDEVLGQVGHGDLLSDTGRIVARNRVLLSRFAPLEEIVDFGLDGLWIDTSPFFEDCGVVVRGGGCLLFAADSGGLYRLDDAGAFEDGDRARVTGIVAAPCAGACGDVDGCIEDNTIGPCDLLPCEVRPCGSSRFHRGDANGDARADISDGIHTLDFLFAGGPPAGCADAADVNDDERLNIADPVYLFGHLFLGGPAPPAPGAPPLPCGPDGPEAVGELGCEAYAGCA
jgi:hypothetical protein